MRHLDLGCGLSPKNPYKYDELYGCDLRDLKSELAKNGIVFRQANLVFDPIPFEDNSFDSVSAMDFLEHIPRQINEPNGKLRNAFVLVMNEIYRVLKPDGVFFASTPIYPHPSAFIDPTHVNIMSDKSYTYFIGSSAQAAMYGFNGSFQKIRVYMDTPNNFKYPDEDQFKKWIRRLHRKYLRGGLSHQVWELKAIKN
jgi:SAM-dependent methyltransferase